MSTPPHCPLGLCDIPRDVHLSLSLMHVCPTSIPQSHGTFHEMSTCPSYKCMCVPWDHGMGWTMGHTRICERDRWTMRGMSQGTAGWDWHFTAFLDTYGLFKGVAHSLWPICQNLPSGVVRYSV